MITKEESNIDYKAMFIEVMKKNDELHETIITKNINSSLRNLGHTNPCSKKKSNPISFSKKCKKPLYSIMQ